MGHPPMGQSPTLMWTTSRDDSGKAVHGTRMDSEEVTLKVSSRPLREIARVYGA